MFVFLLAVPALLVVLLGYVIGHGLWLGLGGPSTGAEAAGWITGLLLLAAVLRWALSRARAARSRSTRPSPDGRRER